MILCIDIGNTKTNYGFYDGPELKYYLSTDTNKYATARVMFDNFIKLINISKISISSIDDIVVSCVVPAHYEKLRACIDILNESHNLNINLYFLTSESVSSLPESLYSCQDIDDPLEVGADFIAAIIAAKKKYNKSFLIVDMGTATNISIIDNKGNFCGGVLLPGVETGMKSLLSNAEGLLSFSVEEPKRVCGKNTDECLNSGFVYGEAARIDGLVDMIKAEKKDVFKVLMTGGWSNLISKYMKHETTLNKYLILEGLLEYYNWLNPQN